MSQWNDSWPTWSDAGRSVELLLADNSTVQGKLTCDDFGFDGEEEYPIFEVIVDGSRVVSFAGAEKWRFV